MRINYFGGMASQFLFLALLTTICVGKEPEQQQVTAYYESSITVYLGRRALSFAPCSEGVLYTHSFRDIGIISPEGENRTISKLEWSDYYEADAKDGDVGQWVAQAIEASEKGGVVKGVPLFGADATQVEARGASLYACDTTATNPCLQVFDADGACTKTVFLRRHEDMDADPSLAFVSQKDEIVLNTRRRLFFYNLEGDCTKTTDVKDFYRYVELPTGELFVRNRRGDAAILTRDGEIKKEWAWQEAISGGPERFLKPSDARGNVKPENRPKISYQLVGRDGSIKEPIRLAESLPAYVDHMLPQVDEDWICLYLDTRPAALHFLKRKTMPTRKRTGPPSMELLTGLEKNRDGDPEESVK